MKRGIQDKTVNIIQFVLLMLVAWTEIHALPNLVELPSDTSSFITTWKTDNPGISDSNSITIPVHSTATYNYDVDWNNDGIFDEFGIDTAISHNFGTPGIYTIRIRGDYKRLSFTNADDAEKIIDVVQWGDIQWTNMSGGFRGCKNLNISAIDAPDLSQASSLSHLFFGCTAFNSPVDYWDVSTIDDFYFTFGNCPNFNQPLNNWDMSNADNLQRMFIGCTSFNQPLDQWNVSKVRTFSAMFTNCTNFNQPIGNWDVSNGIHFALMFSGAQNFNQDIGGWNTVNLATCKSMFHKAYAFNQDISNWNVSKASNFSAMFKNAISFNQNINNWDVSNATDMSWMFAGASNYNQPLDQWNVGKVTNMNWMFFHGNSFNHDISTWDVSSVNGMQNMFKGSNMTFNQDIGNWNVSQVTDMNSMFEHNPVFDQNLGNWDVSNLTTARRMFNDAQLSTLNYDSLLIGWNRLELQDSVDFHAGNSIYCAGWAARANMIAFDGWVITDKGAEKDTPIALCKDTTLSLPPDGTLSIDASILDNGSYDYCTDIQITASKTIFTCDDIGVLSDTITISDFNGNSSTCISNITIQDQPLQFICPPDITVYADQTGCKARATWASLQGNCDTQVSSSHSSGDLFPLGTTTITYIATDNLSNSTTCSFTVTVISDLEVTVDSIQHPSCLSSTDGRAFISISGSQSPYSIDWDFDNTGDFDDQEDQNGLMVGINQVIIRDNVGCHTTTQVNLSPIDLAIDNCPPNIIVTANYTDCSAIVNWQEPIESCSGIALSTNYTSGSVFPLGTTTVTYSATNSQGRSASCSFDVTVLSNLNTSINRIINPSCVSAQDGQVFLDVSGGVAPHSFDWDFDGLGDFDDPQNPTDLTPGIYQVFIKDQIGCISSETIELQASSVIIENCPTDITVAANNEGCSAIVHWTEPREVCSGAALSSNYSSGAIFPLGTTTVSYIASNNLGASAICSFEVTVVNDMSLELDSMQSPKCFETDNGVIDVSIHGGNESYTFEWIKDGEQLIEQSGQLYNLTGGVYDLKVTDQIGCSLQEIFILNQPSALELDVIISEQNFPNFSIAELIVSGGQSPYRFDWDNDGINDFDDPSIMNELSSGTYEVQVQDNYGCIAAMTVTIPNQIPRCGALDMIIYPNPSDGYFKLDFGNCLNESLIEVYDLLGRKLYSETVYDNHHQFILDYLPSGNYWLSIKGKDEYLVKPLMITKE